MDLKEKQYRERVQEALKSLKGRIPQAEVAEACKITPGEIRVFASRLILKMEKVDRLAAYLKEKGLLENIQQSPNQYKSTFPIQSGDTLSPVVRLIELTLDVLRDVDTPPRVKDKHLHYLAETLAEVDKTRI